MNVKARLAKLEMHYPTKFIQAPRVSDEEKWLDDLISSIDDGTYIPMPEPRKPLAPNASFTAIWLHNLLNEMELLNNAY